VQLSHTTDWQWLYLISHKRHAWRLRDTCQISLKNVKSSRSNKAHRTALISISSALSQTYTSLHCETTDTGLLHRAVCLFTPQLVLTAPIHKGMARLS